MKVAIKAKIRFLFFALFSLAVVFFSAACNNTAPLPIAVFTGEWSPYISQSSDGISSGAGGAYGITSDVVTATLREMNYEPDYQFRQWSVIENLINEKKIHSAFPFVKAVSREDSFCFSEPIGQSVEVLFYNKQNGDDNIESIGARHLGVVQGYEYDQFVNSTFARRTSFPNETEAFRALIKGEIDLLPADRQVAFQILEHHFLKDKHRVGIISGFEKANDLYLVMPSKGPKGKQGRCDIDFLDRFNAALKTIDEKGILSSIQNRYQRHFESNRQVQLMAAPGFPFIIGVTEEYQHADIRDKETPTFIIPQGTRAVVVEWNDRFFNSGQFGIDEEIQGKTKVRILEGPLKDRVVWVPNIFVTMAR